MALLPSVAAAKPCGQDEYVHARKDITRHGPSPLALGDSVMLLALYNVADVGYNADGQGCRHFQDAFAVLRRVNRRGRLPHLVVLALGTDGRVSQGQINSVLDFLGPSRVLGLVTPRELGGAAGFDAAVMRVSARQHTKRIVLLDWVKYSAHHGDWFQPDRTHLAYPGARAFARLLGKATRFAQRGRFPHHTVFPRRPGHAAPATLPATISAASSAQAGDSVESRRRTSGTCLGHPATIVGSSRPERIFGTSGSDVINAGGGPDEVQAGSGNDIVCGGRGSDFIYGEDGSDHLIGGPGHDELFGSSKADVLRGGPGPDYLAGGGMGDRIIGGADPGRVHAEDIVSFAGPGRGITANLARGRARGQGRDTLRGVEGIMGSLANDTLIGNRGPNTISGSAGIDLIRGGAGGDLIGAGPGIRNRAFGGPGDDQMLGFYGADVLFGGAGADTILGYGRLDRIHGGPGDDPDLEGNDDNDRVFGGPGNDHLFGDFPPCSGGGCNPAASGDDRLNGGNGGEHGQGDTADGGPNRSHGDTCVRVEVPVRCEH